MATWNWIIPLVIIGINVVFGLFRGIKSQSIRVGTLVLAIVASVAVSFGLQAASGNFKLSNYIAFPEQWADTLSGLVIFNSNNFMTNLLQKVFFMDYCSVLLALLIFIIANKLSILLYHFLNGIGHKTELIQAAQKKKFKLTGGLTNHILGAVLGAVQGIVVVCLVYAPIVEIAIKMCTAVAV